MKKTFYSLLSAIILLVLSACSSDDPFVGEWMPSNDTSGGSILNIKSDGLVDNIADAEDGYAIFSGTWERVSDSENTIKIRFDANTLQIDCDNPIAEMITRTAVINACGEDYFFVLSDDGNHLENTENRQKTFVRK